MFKFPVREKNPVVTYNGQEINISEIPDGSLTLDFYQNVRANSDGFEALYPKLNNKALENAVQNNLNNCGYKTNTTYEGSLQNILVPLLLKRLEEK
jgi:predicted  nucleic acid-binding Zn ribbon protein